MDVPASSANPAFDLVSSAPMQTIRPKTDYRLKAKEPEGTSGTRRFGGRIREEYNADLVGTLGIDKYDEMRRSDAMIRMLCRTRNQPLISAEWVVEAYGVDPEVSGKQERGKAERIRQYCHELIFERLERPFPDLLREMMLYKEWGFAPFYRALKEEDGKLWLKDLYLRHPRSILYSSQPFVFWKDQLVGLIQTDIYAYNNPEFVPALSVFLPIEELVFLCNEREGTNCEGVSDLRSLWRPYYAKKNLIQILLIGLERQAVGIPKFKMAEQFSPKRESQAVDLVTKVRAGDDAGVVLSAGEEMEMMEGKIDAEALLEAIRFCNEEMARAWLQQHTLLGTGGAKGGYALSSDQTDMYMIALKGDAKTFAFEFRKQVFEPLVVANFGPDAKQYTPTLRAAISRYNAVQVIDMWSKAASGDNPLFSMGPNDEDWLRTQVDAPPRSEERLPFIRPLSLRNPSDSDEFPADPGGARGGGSPANKANGKPSGSDLPQQGAKPVRQGDRRSAN